MTTTKEQAQAALDEIHDMKLSNEFSYMHWFEDHEEIIIHALEAMAQEVDVEELKNNIFSDLKQGRADAILINGHKTTQKDALFSMTDTVYLGLRARGLLKTSDAPHIPEGYKLVPVEPTETMSATNNSYENNLAVYIDAVWLAREIKQTARNIENQRKNEPDRYDGIRCTMPELQGRGL